MRIDGQGGVLVTPLGQKIAAAVRWTLTREGAAPIFALGVGVGQVDPYWWQQATTARVSIVVPGGKTWTWPDVALPARDAGQTHLELTLADHPIVT